jgi:hypothetical protein
MRGQWIAVVAASVGFLGAAEVSAKPTWLKKAQAIDPEIKDCKACHTSSKGRELNDSRGQFLGDKKKELGAKQVDLEWLREFKDPAKETDPAKDPAAAPAEGETKK